MTDIFISYSRADREAAAKIAELLKSQGYTVWWDYELIGGERFRDQILTYLHQAKLVLVLWSADSVRSDWVIDEAQEAKDQRKLLPVRVVSLDPQSIPLGFRGLHAEIADDHSALLRAVAARKAGVETTPPTGDSAAAAAAGDNSSGGWQWWSSHATIAGEKPSISAIVETQAAVIIYWWIAVQFNTYAHLLFGVLVAPLLLLRSEKSIQRGLLWFQEWEAGFYLPRAKWRSMTGKQRVFLVAIGLLGLLTSLMATTYLSELFLPNRTDWDVVLLAAGLGWLGFAGAGIGSGIAAAMAVTTRGGLVGSALPVYVAIVGGFIGVAAAAMLEVDWIVAQGAVILAAAIAATAAFVVTTEGEEKGPIGGARAGLELMERTNFILVAVALIPTAISCSLTIVAICLTIRFLATLWHIREGLAAMPGNFRKLVFSTSPLQSPELVPGLVSTNSEFRFDTFFKSVNTGNLAVRFALALVLVVYFPAWLYRVSIKSTAWFWWPLAYISSGPREARDPEHMRRLIMESPFRKLGRWGAFFFLSVFAVVNAWDLWQAQGVAGNGAHAVVPTQTLVIGFLLTRLTDVPWQATGIFSALIALLIGMWTRHAAISLQRAQELKDPVALARASRPFVWIENLARVGFVCTALFWLGLAFHLALYANSRKCWIEPPAHISDLAKTLYGEFAPDSSSCVFRYARH
ncbi:MAG: toll/interleukin-1 receptor domain-containing protein [Hyphomicrobium sp.]